MAAVELQRAGEEINDVVAGMGRAVGKPWRSDQKTAFIAAWVVLATRQHAAA
jgi:hypothetical protein